MKLEEMDYSSGSHVNCKEIERLALEIGFSHTAPVNMDSLIPMPEIREMCAADRCRNYGRSWSCPPSPVCGTPEEAGRRMKSFREGLLLQYTRQMENSFDLEEIESAEKCHKQMFDTLIRQIRKMGVSCLPMTSGGCRRCYKCTYPDRACRYPDRLYVSMEAYGLWVSEVCWKSGLAYNYGENTITYTACVLI